MGRPKKNIDAIAMREQIILAAREEFAAKGFSAPLQAIAKRCGIQRPSLLYYFDSKESLVDAVIEDITQRSTKRLTARLSYLQSMNGTISNADLNSALLKEMVAIEEEEKGVASVVIQALLAAPVNSALAQLLKNFVIQLADLLGQPNEQAAVAHLLMGELYRLALGAKASEIWGTGDGLQSLFTAKFN